LYNRTNYKYYNYAHIPSVLLNYIYNYILPHYLFYRHCICKDRNKNLINNLRSFLSIKHLYNISGKYNNFVIENGNFILFSNNKLIEYSRMNKG
jgi:hypothetical protein